jgi:hypothetical protein
MNMAKKSPCLYLVLVLATQILLIFSLKLLAKGAAPQGEPLNFPNRFDLVDANQNGTPDHLGFFLSLPLESRPDVFWVCGELQAMVNNQWRTIDYTARSFSQESGAEVALYFYGGELKRLQVDGPFRIMIELKGVNLDWSGVGGFSPAYRHSLFEATDVVLTNQGPFSTRQIINVIHSWAGGEGLVLGPLETATFTFDRWRFDFRGVNGGARKRVWYAPTGEINWADQAY